MIGMVIKELLIEYSRIRSVTKALVAGLSAEDMTVQTMPDVSPTKWHLAHTTWFWETFLLKPHDPSYGEFDKKFNYLFNSYYEQVGERHARPERGFLTRPDVSTVMAYRDHVDEAVTRLLSGDQEFDFKSVGAILTLGLAHEQQHQELMLTDIKHVLSRHPFAPEAYPPLDPEPLGSQLQWLEFAGGVHAFGHEPDSGFAFDNEGPQHQAILTPFALADRPVTNAEYRAFIEDGGYETATLWLSEGWARIQHAGWSAPLYWRRRDEAWFEFTLHGEQALDPEQSVTHLSYYEASAFAEWAGARLPDEREWELAARDHAGADGRFAVPGRSAHPGASPEGQGLKQMFGGVWEWTRSPYTAYPRFRPAAGAVGEYNGKFMCNQFVLRGGSCATPPDHVRLTYRNFFPPDARWQFSGIRLAKDI